MLFVLAQSERLKTMVFIARYILQSTVHTVWREKNRRRHGEALCPATLLIRRIDKNMRNKEEGINVMMVGWLPGLLPD